MDCEFLKISEEDLKKNCFIVKVGNENRPATSNDIESVQKGIESLIDSMNLDFKPSIMVSHHCISFEDMSKENLKILVDKE